MLHTTPTSSLSPPPNLLPFTQTMLSGAPPISSSTLQPSTKTSLFPPKPKAYICTHNVVCMAHPRRVKMVAQQIKREVAEMLIKDKVLLAAVLPESALGADMYLSSVTTVSDVEVSKDLQVAKVYISVFGDERGQEIAIRGLKSKEKYVRMQLGRRVQLRMTPEVRFIHDDSLERGSKVIELLDKLKAEREKRERGEVNDSGFIFDEAAEEEEEDWAT